jgi:hypothetical protein
MSTANACPVADPHRQAVDQYFASVVLPVAMATRDAVVMVRWMRAELQQQRGATIAEQRCGFFG